MSTGWMAFWFVLWSLALWGWGYRVGAEREHKRNIDNTRT